MNITKTHLSSAPKYTQPAKVETPPQESSSFGFDSVDAAIFGSEALQGAIPLYGAYKGVDTAFQSAIFGQNTEGTVAAGGALANLAGSATLAYGLISGSSGAAMVGAGLLAGAGVAQGVAWSI